MNCRSKKSIKGTVGIVAAVMLLAGCDGSDILSRTEDTEKDDALQLQQNIEEQDRAEAGSEEQPEQSGQFGQQGQAEEQGFTEGSAFLLDALHRHFPAGEESFEF